MLSFIQCERLFKIKNKVKHGRKFGHGQTWPKIFIFSNLKIVVWFSGFLKQFIKTSWIFWILGRQSREIMSPDSICHIKFVRVKLQGKFTFLQKKKRSRANVNSGRFLTLKSYCNSFDYHISYICNWILTFSNVSKLLI